MSKKIPKLLIIFICIFTSCDASNFQKVYEESGTSYFVDVDTINKPSGHEVTFLCNLKIKEEINYTFDVHADMNLNTYSLYNIKQYNANKSVTKYKWKINNEHYKYGSSLQKTIFYCWYYNRID